MSASGISRAAEGSGEAERWELPGGIAPYACLCRTPPNDPEDLGHVAAQALRKALSRYRNSIASLADDQPPHN
jgi:hypothetical protein